MRTRSRLRFATACAASLLPLAAVDALALAPRAFVASFGNDANPCSLALPCRGFAAAIAQTTPGGEVIVLDSAGYGTVTITKSVSIIAPAGVYAGITAGGLAPAIVVNAPGASVVLRGLTINGGTVAQYGISLQAASELVVDRCVIAYAHDGGIYANAVGATLTVSDTVVRRTVLGVSVAAAADTRVVLDRVRVWDSPSSVGVNADGARSVVIKDSVVAGNHRGVYVKPAAGASASITIDNTAISDNTNYDAITLTAPVVAGTRVSGNVTRSTITRHASGYGISTNTTAPAAASASAAGNLISHNSAGAVAAGVGVISARDNTFARHTDYALVGSSGTVHTVKGADGLPSNAGEEATPKFGTVTAVSPF